jgi:hypothetical protein
VSERSCTATLTHGTACTTCREKMTRRLRQLYARTVTGRIPRTAASSRSTRVSTPSSRRATLSRACVTSLVPLHSPRTAALLSRALCSRPRAR